MENQTTAQKLKPKKFYFIFMTQILAWRRHHFILNYINNLKMKIHKLFIYFIKIQIPFWIDKIITFISVCFMWSTTTSRMPELSRENNAHHRKWNITCGYSLRIKLKRRNKKRINLVSVLSMWSEKIRIESPCICSIHSKRTVLRWHSLYVRVYYVCVLVFSGYTFKFLYKVNNDVVLSARHLDLETVSLMNKLFKS